MIIGYEAKRLFQNLSGLGNYSRNTVNLLTRFYPWNSYLLFTPKRSELFVPPEQVEIISPVSKFSKRFGTHWRIFEIAKIAKKKRVDLFHGLSHVLPFWMGRSGIPTVLTIHDVIYMRFPDFYKKIDIRLYKFHTIGGCRRATKILAISHQTKEDLIHFFNINPDKIVVIHQSCDKLFYERVTEEQKELVRQRYNLPGKFILCVGTIESRKNQLAILKGVVEEKLDVPVVLLGKPTEYKQVLDEFIVEAGIRSQLIFLHGTNMEELQAIYQMAEVMVYPSFFEGFGLPVLEAQASGCPVITSDISSMPEAGGEGALYIDPYNNTEIGATIRKVLKNDEIRKELVQKGAENAALFSEQIVAEKLMSLYQSLVTQK